jgi:hypothetical protein
MALVDRGALVNGKAAHPRSAVLHQFVAPANAPALADARLGPKNRQASYAATAQHHQPIAR